MHACRAWNVLRVLGIGAVAAAASRSSLLRPQELCASGIATMHELDPHSPSSAPVGICCAASCGACSGSKCSKRPGGADSCCTARILRSKRICRAKNDTACSFKASAATSRRDVMRAQAANATIAWGVYGRACDEIEAFTAACIGCAHGSSPLLHGVAIIDYPRNVSQPTYDSWRCKGTTFTFQAKQVLPSRTPGQLVPVTERRYWPRTQALVRTMLAVSPSAQWLIKMGARVSNEPCAPTPVAHVRL